MQLGDYKSKRISTKYCIIRNSSALREVIKLRMKRLQLSNAEVCRRTSKELGFNIDPYNFSNYLSGRYPDRINQHDLITLCRCIGINVSIKIELDETS